MRRRKEALKSKRENEWKKTSLLVKSKVGKKRRWVFKLFPPHRSPPIWIAQKNPIFCSQCRRFFFSNGSWKKCSFHQSESETNFHSLICAIERLHARRFLLRTTMSCPRFKVTRPRIFAALWSVKKSTMEEIKLEFQLHNRPLEKSQISLTIFFVFVCVDSQLSFQFPFEESRK